MHRGLSPSMSGLKCTAMTSTSCFSVVRQSHRNYLTSLKRAMPNVPTMFFGVDLHSARMRMQSRITKIFRLAREAEEMEAIERKIWHEVDVTLYPSQEEVDQVRQLDPSVDARFIVPFCFDEFRSLRKPPGVAFDPVHCRLCSFTQWGCGEMAGA